MFRVIACLQLEGEDAVKTRNFHSESYIGDPINIIRILNEKGAQEIQIIDLNATISRQVNFDFISRLASEAFVPFSYGGGLNNSISTSQLTNLGVERFILNSSIAENGTYVRRLVEDLGSSSVSLSLDLRQGKDGKWSFVCQGNGKLSEHSPKRILELVEEFEIGEVIVKPVNFDGVPQKNLVESYIGILKEIGCFENAKPYQILLSGGFSREEEIGEVEMTLPVNGVVLGSMVCFSRPGGGVLISYPNKYSVVEN